MLEFLISHVLIAIAFLITSCVVGHLSIRKERGVRIAHVSPTTFPADERIKYDAFRRDVEERIARVSYVKPPERVDWGRRSSDARDAS